MTIIPIKCSHCGAAVALDGGRSCTYCGSPVNHPTGAGNQAPLSSPGSIINEIKVFIDPSVGYKSQSNSIKPQQFQQGSSMSESGSGQFVKPQFVPRDWSVGRVVLLVVVVLIVLSLLK
jgi:hypothetical protein